MELRLIHGHAFAKKDGLMGLIYKVESPSGNVYIGLTSLTLEERKKEHGYQVNVGSNTAIHRAMRKYKDLLKWEILTHEDDYEQLKELEISYIKKFNSFKKGYNLTLGGEGPLGRVVSKETKLKISKANTGKPSPMKGKQHTQETKDKISKSKKGYVSPNKGKKMPDAVKEKISLSRKGIPSPMKGKHHTQESKDKMSKALMGRSAPNKGVKQSKEFILKKYGNPFDVYREKSGEYIGTWQIKKYCADDLDIHAGWLGEVLKGNKKSISGYTAKYKN